MKVPIAILERALTISKQNTGEKPYPGYQQEREEYDRQIIEALALIRNANIMSKGKQEG